MSVFRSTIDRLRPYVPGEQPQTDGWLKLNTNENPYPPSPAVIEAIERAAKGGLNVYPDPLASAFRNAASKVLQVDPDWILPANGSDESLTIIVRSFVDSGEVISFPYPSYLLYQILAEIQGARFRHVLLNPDWSWSPEQCAAARAESRLVLVPNPNSPSGTSWNVDEVAELMPDDGVLVIDEAYGDFRDEQQQIRLQNIVESRRVIVTRTLSKSYSLAGLRFGFAIAHPDMIRGMLKVKDSYNCDAISIAAATAAIEDQDWMRDNLLRIRRTRNRMEKEFVELGFDVAPSQANFIWSTHQSIPHRTIFERLKERRILVRFMEFPLLSDSSNWDSVSGLRVTVGRDEEVDRLLEELRKIV